MGLIDKVKEKIDQARLDAGKRQREREVQKQADKRERERGDAEERAVGTIAKKHGLTRDKSIKGRYWINDRQYVDVDPRHAGTAGKLEKVINNQKDAIKVQTYKPPKTPKIKAGRQSTGRQGVYGGGQPPGYSMASQQGDLGFSPKVHGKRPMSPTPDMPPAPGSFFDGPGFLDSPRKKGRR